MNTPTEQISELAAQLSQHNLEIENEFLAFASGVADLTLRVRGRCFVIGFFPKENGFGVDELTSDDRIGHGYRHWYTDFASAKAKLLDMLKEAGVES